jgi:hypothetical protein
MSVRFKGYVYEPKGVGRWVTEDVLDGAVVRYEISMDVGRNRVTETVIRTNGSELVKFLGPLGRQKVYQEVGSEPQVHKMCSSLDMQPY